VTLVVDGDLRLNSVTPCDVIEVPKTIRGEAELTIKGQTCLNASTQERFNPLAERGGRELVRQCLLGIRSAGNTRPQVVAKSYVFHNRISAFRVAD